MGYFFNSLLDFCAIPFAVVVLVVAVWLALRLFVWAVERRAELDYNRQVRQAEVDTKRIENESRRIDLEQARADIALVQLDPTRPLLARNQLETGQYDPAMLMLAAKFLETLQPVQPVPNSLTYSPHTVYRNDAKQIAQDEDVKLLPATTIMDFGQLFSNKMLPADKFLLGANLDDGELVSAGWREFYSTLVIGQSGSGKSTLVRSILAQAALQGSKFMVIDPHFGAGDESLGESLAPLSSLMLTDVAHTDEQMIATLKNIRDVGKRRLAGQDTDKTPVVLVVDETTALLSRSNVADTLVDVLGFISQETRKVGVYAICLGQIFNAEVFPSTVRNAFVNFISCRTRKDNARCATGNNHFATIAENLTIGQCVRMTPAGEVQILAVPNCTQQHLEMVAGADGVFRTKNQLPEFASTGVNNAIGEDENGDAGSMAEAIGKQIGSNREARKQRIINLFCEGRTVTEIMSDLCDGAEITGGRKFQALSNEVQQVLRDYMKGLGGK